MSVLTCIDPGPVRSAICYWSDGRVVGLTTAPNRDIIDILRETIRGRLVIEDIQGYGMVVGRDVFRTCMWIGRFVQALGFPSYPYVLLPRREVKLALCGSARAKDANVRAAILDRLGPVPTKTRPNPNYPRRPSTHEWSAIALALTYEDLVREGRQHELETLEGA